MASRLTRQYWRLREWLSSRAGQDSITARSLAVDATPDFTPFIEMAYSHYLGRSPDASGLKYWTEALRSGLALADFVAAIATSPEAERSLGVEMDELSDGEFVLLLVECMAFKAAPYEMGRWLLNLGEDRSRRPVLVRQLLGNCIHQHTQAAKVLSDPFDCAILGTDRRLTLSEWNKKIEKLSLEGAGPARPKRLLSGQRFQHSGDYLVSAIASLYRGGRYLEQFLDNITSQTIFDRSELIIIDANSPEGEEQVIAQYQKVFPNIVYRRINYQIGIYDAWNLAVGLARGKYLTNTNLDDLRRGDSFALQAAVLDRYGFADVIYQDFFYSFDYSLSFEQVARIGFKSELPLVTPTGLLQCNVPHNAPMWRRQLHADVGLFDATLSSAGDWEFWLRCLGRGKTFFKINTPHIAYYQNPEGISTRPTTRGIEEGERILRRHIRRLTSPYLLMSHQAFAEALGAAPGDGPRESYYNVVQSELKRIGRRSKEPGMATRA